MNDYTNLIAKLEAAEGPSRELDNEIYTHVLKTHVIKPGERPLTSDREYTPQYTFSLDAAVSLVPEGEQYCLGCLSDTRVPVRGVSRYHAWVGAQKTIYAPTPALALCIAALKARQHGKIEADSS